MSIPLIKDRPFTKDEVLTRVRGKSALLILGAALLVGLALRLYGLNWDQGFMFHPDERAILMKVEGGLSLPMPVDFNKILDPKTSPLNPHWFPYGTFPLYLLKLVGHILSFVKQTFASHELRLVGRALSAVFDTGTILLVYMLGRQLYSRRVGLLAAVLVSLAVIHIQLSHFFAVDVMLSFFIILTIYFCVKLAQSGRHRDVVLVGVGLGLSLATKVSMAPILATVAAAFLLNALSGTNWRPDELLAARLNSTIKRLVVCLMVAAVVFVITEPFAILDREAFWSSVTEQSEMVRRIRDYPYTRQYVNTTPYIYPMVQLAEWGLGPAMGIVAWGGLAFAMGAVLLRRKMADFLLLSWVLPYFALTGYFDVKFMRYLLPLVPVLAIFGARMLFTLWDWSSYFGKRGRNVASAAIGVVVVLTGFYALSYMNVYANPHPAVRMSQWINANVQKGALILKEHWEEGIPSLAGYRGGDLNLYENDDNNKLNHIVGQVRGADYIVFYSNRLYGTIPRLPERYPVTSRYYQLLFSGMLGYELVNFETSYPSLLGVSFVDNTFERPGLPVPGQLSQFTPSPISIDGGYADESFTVYDHPKVLLFKKVKALSEQELRALFADIPLNRAPAGQVAKPGLLYSPTEAEANQEGGTWSDLFDRDGITNRFPVLSWLLFVELISIVSLPIGVILFRRFADRGYILTKTLGILLVTYLSWLFAATRLLPFTRPTIFLSIALLGLFSLYLFYRFREDIEGFVRSRWRLLVVLEGVFLAAFFAFYLIRLANPDLWHAWRGGEKPMDFAYLNAVIKTTYFPPYDPWFAGGYLNYYYYGQVIVATLIKGVGIVPAVAYNLVVPLLFALTFAGAFSIGYNLRLAGRPAVSRFGWSWSGLLCGSFAAMFVAVLGNLDGIIQIADGLAKAGAFNFQSTIPGISGAVNSIVGLWRVVIDHRPLQAFDFWRSSRMMPGTINITEFPYFTFLFADLHAHLIALPFTVLGIGAALNVALRPQSSPAPAAAGLVANAGMLSSLVVTAKAPAPDEGKRLLLPKYVDRLPWPLSSLVSWLSSVAPLPRLFPIVALALILGALRIINSWDFPTYLILAAVAIFIGEFARRERLDVSTMLWTIVKAGLVFLLSSALYQPFHDKYELFYSGVEASKEKTLIQHYLAVHGMFLFVVLSYLAVETGRLFGRTGFLRGSILMARYWENLPHIFALRKRLVKKPDPGSVMVTYVLLAVLSIAAVLIYMKLYLIAFLVIVLALVAPLALQELRKRDIAMPGNVFVLAMIGLAVGLGMGVDFITIKGDVSRMNTVFKFYLQAWMLFSLASAYGLVVVLSSLVRLKDKARASFGDKLRYVAYGYAGFTRWKTAWLVALVFLLFSTSIYPFAATRVRVDDRFQKLPPTDDGMAFMKGSIYSDEKGKVELRNDYEAMSWMQDNIKGSPVIVEAWTPLYRWGSRVSIYTGLPTVIGWDWHQTQQRFPYRWMIEARQKDVRDIFASPDPNVTLNLLKKYNVKYVYVGELERLYFGGQAVNTKFKQLAGKGLEPVYSTQAETVTIYEVR